MSPAQELLSNTFKLPSFRPGQEAVIDTLLAGRSALAVFPTGGGKSLCYQLPALMLDGLTLVVSPLIALMKDQVDSLSALGIAAARLDSSLSSEEVLALYDQLDQGRIKTLYVAPERLANERFVQRLKNLRISLMAVDEAHCVSEWGHNFRPDYLKLANQVATLNIERVLALTATATPAVAEQICASFDIAPDDYISTGFYRPNLSIGVNPCTEDTRDAQLLQHLQARPDEPAIVYVTLQKTAESVAALLQQQGLNARAYHAGLPADRRGEIQDAFMAGQNNIIVATIAFGMGIDKADIRAVYHYNLPKSLENYMQEIGRAGRDGEPSQCLLLACPDDLTVLENFTFGDTPDPSALTALLTWLDAQPERFDLSVYELSNQFDLRPLVLNTLLTYLELAGVLRATAPFYSEYRVAFKEPVTTLLARFDAARSDFLQRAFATGKQGRTWLTLQPATIAQQLDEPSHRLVKALNYLEQHQLIDLKVAGVRQGYRRLPDAATPGSLSEKMAQEFAEREQRDLDRLHGVCAWAESEGCLQQPLMAYFGETLAEPCGQCSGCKAGRQPMPARTVRPLDEAVISSAHAAGHAALQSPRALARFLCGITSPQATRAKLPKDRYFGAQAEVPFKDVLAHCETLMHHP